MTIPTIYKQAKILSTYAIPGLLLHTNLPDYNQRKATAIVKIVCDYFGFDNEDITKRSRNQELVLARHFIFYFCKQETKLSLHEIAELVSPKDRIMDHTTVIHGINRIKKENTSKFDNAVKEHFKSLTQLIN